MLLKLLSMNIFTGRSSFMDARGAYKRHHGCYYTHHRLQNLKNLDSTLLLFYNVYISPFFQPSPLSLLRVHLNGIGNVTIHLNVPDNYQFHTNVSCLRLFLQNITCTYDLANGIAQNNLNRMHVFLLINNVIGMIIIK